MLPHRCPNNATTLPNAQSVSSPPFAINKSIIGMSLSLLSSVRWGEYFVCAHRARPSRWKRKEVLLYQLSELHANVYVWQWSRQMLYAWVFAIPTALSLYACHFLCVCWMDPCRELAANGKTVKIEVERKEGDTATTRLANIGVSISVHFDTNWLICENHTHTRSVSPRTQSSTHREKTKSHMLPPCRTDWRTYQFSKLKCSVIHTLRCCWCFYSRHATGFFSGPYSTVGLIVLCATKNKSEKRKLNFVQK